MTIWSNLLHPETRTRLSDLIASWWRIDILVVADTIVSLGSEHDPRNLDEKYFGMGHLIGVLEAVAKVTKAHRDQDPLTAPGALVNFRFNEHDLKVYDQIWLLGYATGQLPLEEQAALAEFMNAGGGVFATGDHAGLGSALAGDLPRVRSMRHWSSPPPSDGPNRVDTTQPDLNNNVVFENQSDDIPQKLRLKWYEWSSSRWTREVYPHPLLCSRSGAITEFPDHMHEGEVVVPNSLDAKMSYPGVKPFDEYPVGAGGQRVSPEVVAWGRTTGRADPEVMHGIHTGDPTPSNERWNGTIGTYDGHLAGVGRVVVHSTWHHFFDINLIGDNAANRPTFNDPRAPLWRQGFRASANGQRVLSQIDQYFRNIVYWLSPNVGLVRRFQGLTAEVAVSHLVREVLDGGKASPELVGAYAWEHALRYVPPCLVLELVNVVIAQYLPVPVPPWDPSPDPRPGQTLPSQWPIPPQQMAKAALGGAVLAFTKLDSQEILHSERGTKLLREGALTGVQQLLKIEQLRFQAADEMLSNALSAFESTESPQCE